jgi:hypothetical protein
MKVWGLARKCCPGHPVIRDGVGQNSILPGQFRGFVSAQPSALGGSVGGIASRGAAPHHCSTSGWRSVVGRGRGLAGGVRPVRLAGQVSGMIALLVGSVPESAPK